MQIQRLEPDAAASYRQTNCRVTGARYHGHRDIDQAVAGEDFERSAIRVHDQGLVP